MEHLEQLIAWLKHFPQWGEWEPTVDDTGAEPGSCGLFPVGEEVLEQREDVLGNCRTRLRQVFLLRRKAARGMDAAAWLLAFSRWACQNAAGAPVFGTRQKFRAEKGRLTNAAQTGTGMYEIKLTFEYENEE